METTTDYTAALAEIREAKRQRAFDALATLMAIDTDILMAISDEYGRKCHECADAPSVRFFGSASLACQSIAMGRPN